MKNLKKGLAVAMSLAMIATVMPTMNVNAAFAAGTVCNPGAEATGKACGKLVFSELFDKTITDYDMDSALTIKVGTTAGDYAADGSVVTPVNVFYAVYHLTAEVNAYANELSSLKDAAAVKAWTKATADIKDMFDGAFTLSKSIVFVGSGVDGAAIPASEILLSADSGVVGVIYDAMTKKDAQGALNGKYKDADTMKLAANKAGAHADKKALDEFANEEKGSYKYLSAELKDIFDEVKYQFDELYTAAFGSSTAAQTADFIKGWDKVLSNDLKGVNTLETDLSDAQWTAIDRTKATLTKVNLSSKASINARIKMIKEAAMYNTVKENDAVISIIEAYEELIDAIDGNKDLTKTDSYKAYVSEKTASADATPKAAINKILSDAIAADPTITTDSAKIAAIVAMLDNEQFEALKAYKEDVLDEVYTMQTRKIGSYHIDDSSESKTVSSNVKNTVKGNVPAAIYALVDTKDGLFGYDVIVEYMADFNEALAAVTTDIEKITPANIKAADKAKLEAAEDAIYELTNSKGDFVNNLTDKEERSLRAAERKIENLREAFDNLGITSATGWYDKGNGNWGYNNEDGTPATKWVAAGKLWYYVKGGDMLRNSWVAQDSTGNVWYYVNNAGEMVVNTTIDGYAINANGEWHK